MPLKPLLERGFLYTLLFCDTNECKKKIFFAAGFPPKTPDCYTGTGVYRSGEGGGKGCSTALGLTKNAADTMLY